MIGGLRSHFSASVLGRKGRIRSSCYVLRLTFWQDKSFLDDDESNTRNHDVPNFPDNIYTPVLSMCPLHTNTGCGKERRMLIGPWRPAKAALVRSYLEVYWSCAGGLSAVNAIGTQLRDPINSGLVEICEYFVLYRIMYWYGNRAMEVQQRNNFVIGSDNTEILGS